MVLIRSINPREILLADNCRNKMLSQLIIEAFAGDPEQCQVLFISRQYFDQDRGAEMLKKVVVGEIDADMISKYTVLAAIYCLLRYVENTTGSMFCQDSLRLQHGSGGRERMLMDGKTAANLEIISNLSSGSQKDSLFGCINRTKSIVGARLLKATLLRPSTDLLTIETRLDVMETFLRAPQILGDVAEILSQFPDLDKMLGGLTRTPKVHTVLTARVGIDTLIFLKHTLKLLPELSAAVDELGRGSVGGAGPLLHTLSDNLSAGSFQTILVAMEEVLTDSTAFSKNADEMRNQECFAVRAGTHGLLDVARTSYLQSVEDIHQAARQYSDELGVTVKALYGASRGYYLQLPNTVPSLPEIFVQAVLNKASISCTTEEVVCLSDRAKESIYTALCITNEVIQDLLGKVRVHMSDLFSLADSVALLDMLGSFADMVASSPLVFSRPRIKEADDGPLLIDRGRHVVMSTLQPLHFVENGVFLNSVQSFQVVSGVNGAGKSTFIKQIAIIVIMAQIGCFVPARSAVVPIRDKIFSRIGTGDDMENNLSTFQVEMKEVAAILQGVSDHSLVIIDELGRGTSNMDGMAIAFAVAEFLLSTTAYCLFVTHYSQITLLPQLYSNATNVHLKSTVDRENSSVGYLHKLGEGPCDMKSGYGILMAESCGFPPEFSTSAREFQRKLKRLFPMTLRTQVSGAAMGAAMRMVQRLVILKGSSLDDQGLRSYLAGLNRSRSDNEKVLMCEYLSSRLGPLSADPCQNISSEQHSHPHIESEQISSIATPRLPVTPPVSPPSHPETGAVEIQSGVVEKSRVHDPSPPLLPPRPSYSQREATLRPSTSQSQRAEDGEAGEGGSLQRKRSAAKMSAELNCQLVESSTTSQSTKISQQVLAERLVDAEGGELSSSSVINLFRSNRHLKKQYSKK